MSWALAGRRRSSRYNVYRNNVTVSLINALAANPPMLTLPPKATGLRGLHKRPAAMEIRATFNRTIDPIVNRLRDTR
jgi:hypothetical protein